MSKAREKRLVRKNRLRHKMSAKAQSSFGRKRRPRVSIFRSNRYIFAQIIDDQSKKTLASITTKSLKEKENKIEKARIAGSSLAQRAMKLKIKEVVFDRNGYKYHGRVKAFAQGLRQGGLKV